MDGLSVWTFPETLNDRSRLSRVELCLRYSNHFTSTQTAHVRMEKNYMCVCESSLVHSTSPSAFNNRPQTLDECHSRAHCLTFFSFLVTFSFLFFPPPVYLIRFRQFRFRFCRFLGLLARECVSGSGFFFFKNRTNSQFFSVFVEKNFNFSLFDY